MNIKYKIRVFLNCIWFFLVFNNTGFSTNEGYSEINISKYLIRIVENFESRNYDSVELNLMICEKVLENITYDVIEGADYYRFKGKLFMIKGDYKESINLFYNAIKIRSEINSDSDSILAYIYNNQGVNYLQLGNFKNAIKFFEKSISVKSIYFESDDPVFLSTYTNLGIVYKKLMQFESALNSFSKAELTYNSIENYSKIKYGKLLTSKANLLKKIGRFEQALIYYTRALSEISIDDNPEYYLMVKDNIGNFSLEDGKEKANYIFDHWLKGLEIEKEK